MISMREWKEYRLGEVASFVKEKMPVGQVSLEDYVTTENMLADKGGIVCVSGLPETGSVTHYCPETVLVSNIRPYFKKIWFSDKEGGCSNDVLCFATDKKLILPHYLYYLLSQDSFFDYIMLGSKGCKMPRGDKDHIMKWDLLLPPIEEQKRIAGVLSSLDDKIDLLNRENATLEALAETLFRHYFTENPNPTWKKGKLGDLIEIKYGKAHKKLGNGIVPVIGSGGIMRYADKALFDRESVLIPRKGSLDNVMYIDEPFWTVDTMFYTKMKTPHVAKFVYQFMKTLDLMNMNVGSAVPSMTTEVLNNVPLEIPSQTALDDYDRIVTPVYKKIKFNQQQMQTLAAQRDTLLPRLMSGEVKVGEQ